MGEIIAERRQTRDENFMEQAIVVAKNSHCLFYKVGAIFVRENRIITSGYNGAVSGDKHCDEDGCAKMENGLMLPPGSVRCRGCHAEMNAGLTAANHGVALKGSIVYVTIRPCFDCAKHLTGAGIKRIVYLNDYGAEPIVVDYLKERGVELEKIGDKSQYNFNFESRRKQRRG